MCKHVAAVLYGVGARLDQQPELLFALRRVDAEDLVKQAGAGSPKATRRSRRSAKVLDDSDLADVFGIEMEEVPPPVRSAPKKAGAMKDAPRKSQTHGCCQICYGEKSVGKKGCTRPETSNNEEDAGDDKNTGQSGGAPTSQHRDCLASGFSYRGGGPGILPCLTFIKDESVRVCQTLSDELPFQIRWRLACHP